MATEYISREAAIKEFCDDCMDREWCKSNGDSCSRIKNINAVPAADVRPVVRGEWREISGNCDFQIYECNKCKRTMLNHGIDKPNFCPNCGSDMREVDADG